MDLILIRHGQSQWNVDQTGGEDAPLTAHGQRPGTPRGHLLQNTVTFKCPVREHVFEGTRDSADNQLVSWARAHLYMDDLREFNEEYSSFMPAFDSPIAALRLNDPVRPAFVSDYYITFHERVMRALEVILSSHQDLFETDAQIGVVSHGGTMGTMIRSLAGSHHFSLNTENTGIHILRWEYQRWHMLAINRTEHLECERWQHEAGKDA